ncbi:MAG: response regulator [Saprospiraceae bacterium]|nr:response regulator [Saprospiraceae bacterium]
MRKFFIVDDNTTIVELLRNTLKNKHNDVYTFNSGEECIENMHLKPDMIFLDHFFNSNNMTGLETLRVIKKTNINARIIILSAQEDPAIVKEYYDIGIDGYIMKDNKLMKNILEIICTYFGN